jgi:hypothetical protein
MNRFQSNHHMQDKTPRLEIELILSCAGTALDLARQQRIKALVRQPLNWEYLLQTAIQHGVLPLIYQNLDKLCREAVPDEVFEGLQRRFRKNAISNLLSTAEMCRIVKLFTTQEIEVIPFKGPTLAIGAYRDLALRQFHDVDFLIRKADVLRAKEILLAEGYQPQVECSAVALHTHHEFPFKGAVYLELQTEMLHRKFSLAINDDDLWQNLIEMDVDGTRLRTLSAENLLVVLCAHGTQSLWKRLIWICDLAELIHSMELNWSVVGQRAQRLGAQRMVRLGLSLAHQLLGAQLPEAALEEIEADRVVAQLSGQTIENLFHNAVGFYEEMDQGRFFIRSRERLSDRLRCYWRMATTPTELDEKFIKLPRQLAFLYYGIRPFRLAGKRGWQKLKHLLH